jgi:hypothetical protein
MQLERKPDFEKVQQRFEAWWRCEIIDRPLASLNIKDDRTVNWPPQKKYATLRDRWFDLEQNVLAVKAGNEAGGTSFTDDNFPMYYPNLGPEACATVFGCELEFGEGTSWSKPNCLNIREVLKLKPNLDTPYWNAYRKATDLSLELGKGKWITGLPDLHTSGDLLASLRDPQNLAMDMMDDPDGVRLACEHVTNFYQLMYDDLYKRIAAAGQPTTTWTNCLHQGRYYVSNCDFICMISPKQFQEAILPSIVRENEFLERNIFHLDGPGALRHLDALLESGKVDGIQWVYGAGQGSCSDWPQVYKKVQAAGKCVQILARDLNECVAMTQILKPQGVWFCPGEQCTREDAKKFLDYLERWAAGKR